MFQLNFARVEINILTSDRNLEFIQNFLQKEHKTDKRIEIVTQLSSNEFSLPESYHFSQVAIWHGERLIW